MARKCQNKFCHFSRLANFYIFEKYREIEDNSTREYMQYFATKNCESEKIKRIHELVEIYRRDPITKKAYMTLEQELNLRYEKGVKEGCAENNRQLAKGMRDKGVSMSIIAELTGLSEAEILAL
ncbi:MAG: hypothetical protein MJY47_08305 [Fibrobacter sp.]|nr:hypothetical protein [Fibrobacter sp.]